MTGALEVAGPVLQCCWQTITVHTNEGEGLRWHCDRCGITVCLTREHWAAYARQFAKHKLNVVPLALLAAATSRKLA